MLFGFRFQYKQGYQSGRGKDAIAFSEQMIVGYDILLMAKGMGKFFEGGGRVWNVKCTITVYDNCDNKDNKDNRQ